MAGFGLFGWLVFIALSRVWVALGWAFLHTKRPADQLMLHPKPQNLNSNDSLQTGGPPEGPSPDTARSLP